MVQKNEQTVNVFPSNGKDVNLYLSTCQPSRFDFTNDAIAAIQTNPAGELIIFFNQGGSLTVTNFKTLTELGLTPRLEDGSPIRISSDGMSQSSLSGAEIASIQEKCEISTENNGQEASSMAAPVIEPIQKTSENPAIDAAISRQAMNGNTDTVLEDTDQAKVKTPQDGPENGQSQAEKLNNSNITVIEKPDAEQAASYKMKSGQKYEFDSPLENAFTEVTPIGTLVIRFPDGSVLLLQDFGEKVNTGNPPVLFTNDGGMIDTVQLLSLATKGYMLGTDQIMARYEMKMAVSDVTAEELAEIEPVAGNEALVEDLNSFQVVDLALDKPMAADNSQDLEGDVMAQAALEKSLFNIEPAAGPQDLANIEPGAGGGPGDRGGYGFQDVFLPADLSALAPLGGLAGTALARDFLNRDNPDRLPPSNNTPSDDNPSIKGEPLKEVVDETCLSHGPHIVTDKIVVDFGSDGPGTIEANGAFTSDVANLQSKGEDVHVIQNGNTYAGTAGGRHVFTLVIEEDGEYVFTLFDTLDHPDDKDPNDPINLDFGFDASDNDGDSASSMISVKVLDDSPTVTNSAHFVNEAQIQHGPITKTGQLDFDFGEDGPGLLVPNGRFEVRDNADLQNVPAEEGAEAGPQGFAVKATTATSQGDQNTAEFELTYMGITVEVARQNNSYIGTAGHHTVFRLDIDSSTGKYTYTQYKPLDDPPASDIISLDFYVDVIDFDGDTVEGFIEIDVFDNGNRAPDAVDDHKTTAPDTAVDVDVLQNDSDPDGDPIAVTTLNMPSNGAVVNNGDGTITYTPDPGFIGTDSFTYTITDFNNGIDTATVTVKVEKPNNAPDAKDDHYKVFELDASDFDAHPGDSSIDHFQLEGGATVFKDTGSDDGGFWYKLPVLNNDHDPDGDHLTITGIHNVKGLPHAASLHIDHSGQFIVMKVGQDLNFKNSTVTFDYTVEDKHGATDKAHVKVIIDDKNSPLVLDLDGDGVEIVHAENSDAMFDLDLDGEADDTGWISGDDGFLALDINGDGIINDKTELFGDNQGFANGFEQLATLDTNQDGIIDSTDDKFRDLQIWQDKNEDGQTDQGELNSLDHHGIASIDLNADIVNKNINGQLVTHESTFTKIDGSVHSIEDVWFSEFGDNQSEFSESGNQNQDEFIAIEDVLEEGEENAVENYVTPKDHNVVSISKNQNPEATAEDFVYGSLVSANENNSSENKSADLLVA